MKKAKILDRKLLKIYFSLLALFSVVYVASEPSIGEAQSVSDQFVVTQSISAEISLKTAAADVAMSPAIAGITGGTANGSTYIVILTNNDTGYTMTISASNSPAMRGNVNGGSIADYTTSVSNVPDYAFDSTGVRFGYTVSAASTSDLAQKFLDNGSACNTGALDTSGSTSCWYGLSTTATSVVSRNTYSPSTGATTTLYFRTYVPANSFIIEDTYTATSTLTATMN
jgi:hypothetical protein